MSQKRHFPYYSAVPEIEIKKRGISGVNPGREYMDPRTFVPESQYNATPVPSSEVRCPTEAEATWDKTQCMYSKNANTFEGCVGICYRLSFLDRTRDQGVIDTPDNKHCTDLLTFVNADCTMSGFP